MTTSHMHPASEVKTDRAAKASAEVMQSVAPQSNSLMLTRTAGSLRTPRQVIALQRAAGNRATTGLIALQRDDPPAALERRVAALEKRQAATELDGEWRARFGSRLAAYRQATYALTRAWQTAQTAYAQAHNDQSQEEAVKDQVFGIILNVGAAGLAEPFLRRTLGRLGDKLDDTVEVIENPLVALAQGAVGTGVNVSVARRGQAPAQGEGAPGDPLSQMTANLQAIENQSQRFEDAFVARSTSMSAFTPEQWIQWDPAQQRQIYANRLAEIDRVAIPDISALLHHNVLSVVIELYYWAAWIRRWYRPGVSGLQVGRHLAQRMKAIGVESLAGGVRFDTNSWIFMDHQPDNWDEMLANWARGFSHRLTQ